MELRRFVLRQMSDLPVGQESLELVEPLLEEQRRPESRLAAHVTTVLSGILPRALAAEYGYDPAGDAWDPQPFRLRTAGKGKRAAAAPAPSWLSVTGAPGGARSPESEVWSAAGSHLLEECLEPLTRAAAAPATRALALRCLTRFLHPRARSALVELSKGDPLAAVALAETGDPGLEEPYLDRLAAGVQRFELVRLLGHWPSARTLLELKRALRDPDPHLRTAAAIALEGFGEHDPVALARGLLTKSESRWPLVHATDSIAHCASRDAVPVLIALFRQGHADPLVEVALVRAVSNLGGPEAAQFCVDLLDRASPPVQAVSLEGLVLLGHPLEELRGAVPRLMESEHPRLAQNAALVMTKLDPEVTTRRVVGLLRSGSKSERLRAAFLLGYLRSEIALKVTEKLALDDPSRHVRGELLRCLARYHPEDAGPALASTLAQREPALRARALSLWARTGYLPADQVAGTLTQVLDRERDPEVRAAVVKLLGQIGESTVLKALAAELASDQPALVRAAAQGIAFAGASTLVGEVASRAASAPPELRGRLAATRWVLGDAQAPAELARLLAEPATFEGAALALEEVCLLLPRLPASPRHGKLSALLAEHVRSPGYAKFSSERLGLPAPAAVRPPPGIRQLVAEMELSGTVDVASARELMRLDLEAIKKLPRTEERPTGRSSATRLPLGAPPAGPGLPARAALAASVVVLCALAFAVLRAMVGGGAGGIGTAQVDGVMILGVSGRTHGGPPRGAEVPLVRGTVLAAPCLLRTEKDSRITARPGPLPAGRLVLSGDSAITVQKISIVREASSEFEAALAGLAGECLVDLNAGAPRLTMEVAGATLTGQRCAFRCAVTGDRAVLRVATGPLTFKRAGEIATLGSGERREWSAAGR